MSALEGLGSPWLGAGDHAGGEGSGAGGRWRGFMVYRRLANSPPVGGVLLLGMPNLGYRSTRQLGALTSHVESVFHFLANRLDGQSRTPFDLPSRWAGVRMMVGPRFPTILSVDFRDFAPVLDRDANIEVGKSPVVILGGNGLGKTTLMQAVAFGLAGPMNEDVEPEKALRWGHKYFGGRFRSAHPAVRISFSFGDRGGTATVERDLGTGRVSYFGVDAASEAMSPTEASFDRFVREVGGFKSMSDFAFVVHRLLYLPETRRLLAWDSEAQNKILMICSSDLIDEREFQENSRMLINEDSTRRHLHVALEKSRSNLKKLKAEFQELSETTATVATAIGGDESKSDVPEVPDPPTLGVNSADLVGIADRIETERSRCNALQRAIDGHRSDLDLNADEVEQIRTNIDKREAAIVREVLSRVESDPSRTLPIAALRDYGICPACGEDAPELRQAALRSFAQGRCELCHAFHGRGGSGSELATLQSQLSEKLRAQVSLSRAYFASVQALDLARSSLRAHEIEFEKAQSHVASVRSTFSTRTPTSSPAAVASANAERGIEVVSSEISACEKDIADKVVKEQALQRKVDELLALRKRSYERFIEEFDPRLVKLRASYVEYASQFLGIECTLERSAGTVFSGRFELPSFIPRFGGHVRSVPEACSEAQRFFLDIAFRMSVIDWAACGGTFLCETPENALDATYIQNVAAMFKKFDDRGHAQIVTCNIQTDGLARRLLAGVTTKNVLNLFEFGNLSEVHRANRETVNKIVSEIMA
jgi:hypothetical protein